MSEQTNDQNNDQPTAQKTSKAVWATIGAGVLLSSMRWVHFAHLNPVGALSFFGGARLRSWHAYLLPAVVLFVTDIGLWMIHGFHPLYSPLHITRPFIYGIFMMYVFIGRFSLNSRSPVRIGISLIAANAMFFLSTNFMAWLISSHLYTRDLSGLLTCFLAGLPFADKGSPIGYAGWSFIADVGFGALLFGIYAVAVRVGDRAPATTETQPVAN